MISAWHNEPSLKAAAIDRLREHRKLDEIVQKQYWVHDRGCQLGCLTHANDNAHEEAERLFGLPQRIGYWLEAVFEALPKTECAEWVLKSSESIPVGADLSRCHHQFAAWLLSEDTGILAIVECNRESIARVRQLHERALVDTVTHDQWSAAESAAWSAAWSAESAARSAAESARSAARSAAESARSAARSAAESARSAAESAESAAWSAAWSASRSAAWSQIAAKSVEIFKSAPIAHDTESTISSVEIELCSHGLWCREENLTGVTV